MCVCVYVHVCRFVGVVRASCDYVCACMCVYVVVGMYALGVCALLQAMLNSLCYCIFLISKHFICN